jgi:hypothetical protein
LGRDGKGGGGFRVVAKCTHIKRKVCTTAGTLNKRILELRILKVKIEILSINTTHLKKSSAERRTC